MPNTDPVFSRVGHIEWPTTYVTAVNTTNDLTAGTSYLIFTADATAGSFVSRIRFRAGVGTTTATVARVWINNGATTATAANNALFDEITLPATTTSATAATAGYELPVNAALPPGYKLYITLGTGSAAGWMVTVIGGKY